MIEHDQDRSGKKKKRKKRSSSTWLVVGIVGGVLLLIGVILIVVVRNLPPANQEQAKGEAAQGQAVVPPQPEQNVAHFGKHNPQPKGVVQSVRAAAYRPQRINDLKQIGQLFIAFAGEFNRNPRTEDEFIMYIQRDSRDLVQAIREKYYVLNLKARMSSNSAIAYESLTEANCHQTAHGDGSVSLVTPEDLKTMLMP